MLTQQLLCVTRADMSSELRLIFILGAHRSGTSALAGALAALLAPLRSEVLLTSQDDLAILRILTAYQPPLAGIKSPELMYTAALWAGHSAGVRVVATIRHPSAVVRSARRRLATEQGSAPPSVALLARWRDYNTMLLALRERLPFPIVDFSGPFDRYVDQIRGASEALGVIFDPKAVLTFLSEDLRHEREEETLDPATSQLYDQLRKHADEPPSRAGEVPPERALEVFGRPRMPSPMDDEGARLSDRCISPSCDWLKRCARSSA